jgi:hypothetical protein
MSILKVTGDKELLRKLTRLSSGSAVGRVERKGMSAGMKRLSQEMKRRAPNKTARKAIGRRVRASRNVGTRAIVGINVGRKGEKRSPQVPLLALGTEERTRKSGGSTGKIKPNDWIEQSFNAQGPAAIEDVKRAARKQLEVEATR